MIHSIASPEQVGAVVDAMVDRMLPDLQADVHLASLEQTPSGWRLMP
jgi:hypothetical protein